MKMKSEISQKPTIINLTSSSAATAEPPKPPRRVLPEHEGRYKIILPSGTTPKTREIMAKKAMCKNAVKSISL